MSTKDFKEGMVAGAKPFGDKLDQLADVSENAVDSIEEGVGIIQDTVGVLIDDLEMLSTEKEVRDRERLGLSNELDIRSLSEMEKEYLVLILSSLSVANHGGNDDQKTFMRMISRYMGAFQAQSDDSDLSDVLSHINDIDSTKVKKAFLRVAAEFLILGDEPFAEKFDAIKNLFSLDPVSIEKVKSKVDAVYNVYGKELLIEQYEMSVEEERLQEAQADGIDADNEKFGEYIVETENSTDKNCDALRQIVDNYLLQVFPEEKNKGKKENQQKRQKKFLEKYAPQTLPKTVAAIAELPMKQLLFTTSGVYISRLLLNKCIFVRYGDIDTNASTIEHQKNILHLIGKDGAEIFSFDLANADSFNCAKFLEMVDAINHVTVSESDATLSMANMPEDIKIKYSKILICFLSLCKHEVIEGLRFANDLKLSDSALNDVLAYLDAVAEEDFLSLLSDFYVSIPYPSEESACYSLLQDMAVVIQYATGRCRQLTGEEERYIRCAAETFHLNAEILKSLIPTAQINYRILKHDISKKEMDTLGKKLVDVAESVGIPVAAVVGANMSFLNAGWLLLIPGFAPVLGITAIGITVAGGISSAVSLIKKNNADKEKMDAEYSKIIQILQFSYFNLYAKLKIMNLAELMDELRESARRADPVLEQTLN